MQLSGSPRVALVALSLSWSSLAACGGGGAPAAATTPPPSAAPTCRDAGANLSRVAAAGQGEIDPGALDSLTSVFADACTQFGWTPDAIGCFAGAETDAAFGECVGTLTPEQQQGFVDMLQSSFGPPAGGEYGGGEYGGGEYGGGEYGGGEYGGGR
jgi:hypothetical protein